MFVSFFMGFLTGLSVGAGAWLLREHAPFGLKEDEKYLLAAAKAARGRLIIRRETASTGETLLLLKEFPNPRRIEDHQQIEKLLAMKFLVADPSGLPGRYTLTKVGAKRSDRLPDFPLQPVRAGSWFNSISRPLRGVRR